MKIRTRAELEIPSPTESLPEGTTEAELSAVDESDWKGLAILDQKVKPGEDLEVLIDVTNPPHNDWPPVAEVKRSYPTEVWVVLDGEIVDRFPDDKMPIDPRKIDVNVQDGDLLIEFQMPKCLQLDIKARVGFPKTTTLRQTADQDHPTVSDTQTYRDVVVTLRVFAATSGQPT